MLAEAVVMMPVRSLGVGLAFGVALACGSGAPDATSRASQSDTSDATRPERERPSASAADGTAPAATEVVPSDAGNDVDPDGFRAPWCAGPGQDILARVEVMYWITSDYERDRTADCETAGLLPQPSEALRMAWWDYLIGFSAALAGCPPFSVEVPGGIRAFGPANTAAIGVPRPRLGMDDVSSLISKYMAAFAAELGLTADERQAAEMHLWRTAEGEMDPSASDILSTCGASAP